MNMIYERQYCWITIIYIQVWNSFRNKHEISASMVPAFISNFWFLFHVRTAMPDEQLEENKSMFQFKFWYTRINCIRRALVIHSFNTRRGVGM